jgi:glutaredoxin
MKSLISAVLLVFCSISFVQGEIVKYTDANGKVYFVDSAEKVPEAYKNQVEEGKKLPTISKVKRAEYDQVVSPYSDSNSKKKVEVFVTTWCPHCKELENYLNSNKISYIRYDIEKDAVGQAKYRQLGTRGVPVTKIGSEVISGFNPSRFHELLGK